MAELNRLFFALWPDEAVRSVCAEAARTLKLREQPGGYLVKPEKFHVTLLFLGDFVPAAVEAAACKAAAGVRAAPFTLQLDHAGSFRNNRQIPWWLGPREVPPALTRLYQNLREALIAAQAPPERMRFVPHLTILRDAQRGLPDTALKPVSWEVRDFALIRSRLDRSPSDYEVLGQWPLIEGPPSPRADQLALF